MYRPDGWECPYKPDNDNDELYCDIGARDQSIFEAGADAMLKALRREGNSRGGRVENDPQRGTGTWLFIPEEKGESG